VPSAKRARKEKDEAKEWFKVEDEIYYKVHTLLPSFPFSRSSQHATEKFEFAKSHSEARVVMLIDARKIPQILQEIREYIQEGFSW